jgi:hypothetical protein
MHGVDFLNIGDITLELMTQTRNYQFKSHFKNLRSSKLMQSLIRRSWKWWKRVARRIGDFNARVILTLFYFIFLAPFALAVRLFTDPLAIKNKSAPSWGSKPEAEETLMEQARKQS